MHKRPHSTLDVQVDPSRLIAVDSQVLMIEVFKILTGKYDTAAAPVIDIYDLKTTRGNDFKLNKVRVRYD